MNKRNLHGFLAFLSLAMLFYVVVIHLRFMLLPVLLVCGAPLSHMKNKKQIVDIYWRGRFLKSSIFHDNSHYPLQIEDHEHSEGFLEFRVRPTFNLKRMGLGAEARDLGVQLSGGNQ